MMEMPRLCLDFCKCGNDGPRKYDGYGGKPLGILGFPLLRECRTWGIWRKCRPHTLDSRFRGNDGGLGYTGAAGMAGGDDGAGLCEVTLE